MLSKLSIVAALLAAGLSADNDTTKLIVQVKTLGDKPIDRASVVVNFVQGRSVVKLGKKVTKHWELRTNQEGMARIPSIPQGKILIQVKATNYQTFGQTFDIDSEEKTIVIKLNPPQQQYSAHQ